MILLALTIFMGSIITTPQPVNIPKFEYKVVNTKIGSKIYKLKVADTILKQHVGLSYRKGMEKEEGMLFIFSKPAIHEFCMVDMHFPLDLIWIRGDKVIALMENVPITKKRRQELKGKEILKIDRLADKVIELNAGEAQKNNIRVGNTISFIN